MVRMVRMVCACALAGFALSALAAGDSVSARERKVMHERVERMDWWDLCIEAGTVARQADADGKPQAWKKLVLERARKAAQFSARDARDAKFRRLRVGMSRCTVAAVLGRPSRMSQSEEVEGHRDMWGYERRSMVVYFVNGTLNSWQQ